MTHYSDGLAMASFLSVLKQFATPALLLQALARTGRHFRARKLPAASFVLLLVTTFLQPESGLLAILLWIDRGRHAQDLSEQARLRLG